jgi:orotate phosphoribosyltransferase
MIEAEVASVLLSVGAVGFTPDAPVTFKSGIVSPVYVDNRRLPFYPQAWRVVIEGFAALLVERQIPYDVIAGIETAGIPHSAALAYHLSKPSVFVRKQPKEHGLKNRVEGGNVGGKRVLLVEDLVTTGGSSISGVSALREAGAEVTDCLAIVSYGFMEARNAFAQAGVELHTLTNFAAILNAATQYSEADRLVVREWLDDPHGWAGKRGE